VTKRRLQSLLGPKSKVIHPLFWYAVQQERRGDTGLFDAILNLIRREFDGSHSHELLWPLSASKMCTYGSPRAVAFAGPYIYWSQRQSADAQSLISKWAAGISVAPHTEEVAGIVVDTLLQIVAIPHLRPFIPADTWSWLNDRPPLPPSCKGLESGCNRDIVRTVRALGDIGILTSYLITMWSEWNLLHISEFVEMRVSVREDFKGIGMGYHRAELIQRLDSISINQRSRRPSATPSVTSAHSFRGTTIYGGWAAGLYPESESQHREPESQHRELESQHQEFKRILQEMDQEATEILNRMPSSSIFLSMLTLMGLHRTPPHLHVCPTSPVSVTSRLRRLTSFEISRLSYSRSIPLLFPCALPVDLEQSQFYLNI